MEHGSETTTITTNTSTQTTSSSQHTEKEVLIASLSASLQSYKAITFTNQAGSLACGVKDFSTGFKFTAFHLDNNDLVFMTNQQYLENGFNLDKIRPNNMRKNVAKFSTAANELFYLTTSGQLYVVFSKTNTEFVEGVLENSVNNPIADMTVSYPHAIVQLKDNSFRCFDMTNLTVEDVNSSARVRSIEGLENKSIVSFCAGVSFAYFLTAEGKIFECNFKTTEDHSFKATSFEHFNNSTIRKLWCGKGTFFALEQNERLSIDNWNQKEILEWVQQNKDFEDYIKIIKSENVSGKELLTADTEFLVDRLGLQKEDLQTKFLNEIEKVSRKTYSIPKLYGWGNNNSGQLGLNSTQANVGSPMEIKTFPELEKNDFIEHIECGTKATIIVTHSGRVYITEIPNKDNKDKTALKWVDLTPTCQSTKKGKQNRAARVSLNKDHLAIFVNVESKEAANNEQSGSNKLKGADRICDRLLWDKTLNKDEFVVGYEDRFLGILEIPFTKFCLKTDIPTHRIKFFKQNGEIVWDRVAKTNNIGL